MPRKKISEEFASGQIENLDDGEEIIITETKKIKKETVKRDPEPETISIADDDADDDFEFEQNPYEEGTLGYLLYKNEENEFVNRQCNILVVRKPDSPGENFRNPCLSRLTQSPIRNVDLKTPENEIEEQVRTFYGGGHYYLQLQIGNRMLTGWNADLADPIEPARRETQNVSIATEPSRAETEKPLSMLETLQLANQLKNELFGEEQKKIEKLESDLAAANEKIRQNEMQAFQRQLDDLKNRPPDDELSAKVRLIENTQDKTLKDKLIESLVPDEEKEGVIGQIIRHRQEIKGVVSDLAGMFFGIPTTGANAGNVADIMTMQPPTGNEQYTQASLPVQLEQTEKRSNFQRRQPQTDSEQTGEKE